MSKVVTLGALTSAQSTFFLYLTFSKDRLLDPPLFFHYFASLGSQCMNISQNAIFKWHISFSWKERQTFQVQTFHTPTTFLSCYKIVLLNTQRMVCLYLLVASQIAWFTFISLSLFCFLRLLVTMCLVTMCLWLNIILEITFQSITYKR